MLEERQAEGRTERRMTRPFLHFAFCFLPFAFEVTDAFLAR
jgi:hypothetical protein